MKIRKINNLFWAVIEKTNSIFVGVDEDFKKSVHMCLKAYMEKHQVNS